MSPLFHRRLIFSGGTLLLLASCLAGCGEPDEIQEYTVTKPPVAQDRMLAAMIPEGTHTWFFKLEGPDAVVEEEIERFLGLVQSVRFPKPNTPAWDLPEDWKQQLSSGELYATISIPAPEKSLELTVTILTTPPVDLDEYRLMNVNRWRGQLGLNPISPADLPKQVVEVSLKDTKALVVNLVGKKTKGGNKRPPFAAMNRPAPAQPPASSRPATPTFDVPAEWSTAENDALSMAAFEVVKGDQDVRITITAMAPIGTMVLSNVNRWRGQVGLPPAEAAAVKADLKDIALGNETGQFVELVGPKGKVMFVVILNQPGRTWYFKMLGDTPLAMEEKARFQAFVQSVRFSPAKEAGDE